MRRKVRIFSTIVSLALVLAVMCVGIWAGVKRHVKLDGHANLQPDRRQRNGSFCGRGRHQAGELRSGVLQL